jgi:hypothetical protein
VTSPPFVHRVGPLREELRAAPSMHKWTLIIAIALNVWLFVFTLVFVPYGIWRWGWGYNLGN